MKELTNTIRTITDTEYIICKGKISKVQKNLYKEICARDCKDSETFELMHVVNQELKAIKNKQLAGRTIRQAVLAIAAEPEKVKNAVEYFYSI